MLNINLDDKIKIKIKEQAEKNGHTFEQEIIEIIAKYFEQKQPNSLNLADRIKQKFSEIDNVEIPQVTRDKMRDIKEFEL